MKHILGLALHKEPITPYGRDHFLENSQTGRKNLNLFAFARQQPRPEFQSLLFSDYRNGMAYQI